MSGTDTDTPTDAAASANTDTPEEPPEEYGGPGALFIGGIAVVVLAVVGGLHMVYGRN